MMIAAFGLNRFNNNGGNIGTTGLFAFVYYFGYLKH